MNKTLYDSYSDRIDLLADELYKSHPMLETKIRRSLMCGAEEARQGLVETIKFLSLVAEQSNTTLTPAHRVDLVWHEFILFTRAYADFCQVQFGKFIHHNPGGTQKENRKQFAATLSLYESRYGIPPRLFWGGVDQRSGVDQRVASCGNCETTGV